MTFALDHAPSKYEQIKQSTDTFTAFSHVQYPGSHVTLYTVFLRGYWRLDTLVMLRGGATAYGSSFVCHYAEGGATEAYCNRHYAEGGATEVYCNRAVCHSVRLLQVFLVTH